MVNDVVILFNKFFKFLLGDILGCNLCWLNFMFIKNVLIFVVYMMFKI